MGSSPSVPSVNPIPDQPVQRPRNLVIGLAGGIASGKSLVADMLGELGAKVIDSDKLVHRELADPVVTETYRSWWGPRVSTPEGCIDRAAVANIIFDDPGQRERMEKFLYPRLECRRRELMARYEADPSVTAVVLNAPLLYEAGLDSSCDVVLFVDAPRADRLDRAEKTRGWSEQEFDRRENLQKPLDKKRDAADHILVNNSSPGALRSQVRVLLDQLIADWLGPKRPR